MAASASSLLPGQTFTVTAEMAAFQSQQKELTLGALPCDSKLDFDLSLVPRDQPVRPPLIGRYGGRGRRQRRARRAAPTGRFTQLTVRSDPAGAATLDVTPPDQSAELARLLPPGFTLQSASADAMSVIARGDAINVDRGILNDRMSAIGRGEFDPATGQFATGFTPLSPEEGFGQRRRSRRTQRRAAAVAAGRARRLCARRPRRARPEPVSGIRQLLIRRVGARFDQLPAAQRRRDARQRAAVRAQQLRRHDRWSAHHSRAVQRHQPAHELSVELLGKSFDVAAGSVPDRAVDRDAERRLLQEHHPARQPGNGCSRSPTTRFPSSQYSPTALALLGYIPEPNVPGAITQNFHTAATTLSCSNSVSLRINQNLTPTLPQRGAGPGGRAAAGGGGRGGGAPGGAVDRAAAAAGSRSI